MKRSDRRAKSLHTNTGLGKPKPVVGKTRNQEKILESDNNLVIHGFAGTGKSFLALSKALNDLDTYPNIKIIRSAVATRDMGHLPGSYEEKLAKYERPYIAIVDKLYCNGTAYSSLKQKGIITFDTTSYVRGDNWNRCSVIIDECQNMTFHELDSIITRLEDDVKVYFLGDCNQADLKTNGFGKFIKTIQTMNGDHFDYFEMTKEDIVRSKLVKDYIIAKDKVGS